jgi:biopolymer transport protein ExbB/TolQ
MEKISEPKREGIQRSAAFVPAWVIAGLIQICVFQTSGCSTAKPTEALSRAELNLRTALEARADELAPMDLRRARENLENSKKAAAAGRHDEARRLAEIAEAEAELAEAKADAEIARGAADRLRRSLDALRQEMERGTTSAASKE